MGNSEGRIAVQRENVEGMLDVRRRFRGAFNPDTEVLGEQAPGVAAFAERLELGIDRLEALLASSESSMTLEREDVESMLERLNTFRLVFNPDGEALKENAPGIAVFAERLARAAERLEASLK